MGERRQGTTAWQAEPCASAEFLAGLFWGWVSLPQHDAPMEVRLQERLRKGC